MLLENNEANILSLLYATTSHSHVADMNFFHSISDYNYSFFSNATKAMVAIISKLYKLDFIVGENLENKNFKVTSVTEKGIQYLTENPPEVKYN